MKDGKQGDCSRASFEDLLLLAYGESTDPGLAGHARECPVCRERLAEIEGVRSLAAKAGIEPASDRAVDALMAQAASGPAESGSGSHRTKRAWLAAAAVVAAIALSLYFAAAYNPAPPPAGNGAVPAYLAGLGADIYLLEKSVDMTHAILVDSGDSVAAIVEPPAGESLAGADDFSLDPGGWGLVMDDGGEQVDMDSIELAMLDLEYGMETGDVLRAAGDDNGSAGVESLEGEGPEDLELWLLPGLEAGKTF